MNLLSMLFVNPRMLAVMLLPVALIVGGWFIYDKIGDSRELDVKNAIAKQETRANEAELKGRARARACHALGPDRLWDVEHERCDQLQPVRKPGG